MHICFWSLMKVHLILKAVNLKWHLGSFTKENVYRDIYRILWLGKKILRYELWFISSSPSLKTLSRGWGETKGSQRQSKRKDNSQDETVFYMRGVTWQVGRKMGTESATEEVVRILLHILIVLNYRTSWSKNWNKKRWIFKNKLILSVRLLAISKHNNTDSGTTSAVSRSDWPLRFVCFPAVGQSHCGNLPSSDLYCLF